MTHDFKWAHEPSVRVRLVPTMQPVFTPGGRRRAATFSARRTSKTQLNIIVADTDYPPDVQRPRTRGDCKDGQRPCPFASCRYHLAVEVHPERGSLKIVFPDREVWELPETCALDVADRGGSTLETCARTMNITRERLRQLESAALYKLPREALWAYVDDDVSDPVRKRRP